MCERIFVRKDDTTVLKARCMLVWNETSERIDFPINATFSMGLGTGCTTACQCNGSTSGYMHYMTHYMARDSMIIGCQWRRRTRHGPAASSQREIIWNPVHLDRIGQIGTYWYVPVRTATTWYKAVRESHGHTYWYVSVHTSTYTQEDKLFPGSSRKSQKR